jgi:regulator of nucleoside diphosphate kinase
MSTSDVADVHSRPPMRRTTPVRSTLRYGRRIAEYRASRGATEFDTSQPCLLTATDYSLLADYAEGRQETQQFEAQLLQAKLSIACIVTAEEIGMDVVTLDSRVAFRIDSGALQTRILAHRSRELRTITPLTVAMLGRRVGDTVRFHGRDGSSWTVTIEEIPY